QLSPRARALSASVVLSTFVACTLGAGSFAGKTCDTQADCPEPYTCAQVRPGGSTCEMLHGIDSFVTDGGGTGGGGGGGGGTVPGGMDCPATFSPLMVTAPWYGAVAATTVLSHSLSSPYTLDTSPPPPAATSFSSSAASA